MSVFRHDVCVNRVEIIEHPGSFVKTGVVGGHEIYAVIEFAVSVYERLRETYKSRYTKTYLIRNRTLLSRFASRKFCAPVVIRNV